MQHAMEVNGGRVVQLIGNFEDDAVTQIGSALPFATITCRSSDKQ